MSKILLVLLLTGCSYNVHVTESFNLDKSYNKQPYCYTCYNKGI